MAKTKEKKNYEFTTGDGKFTFKVLEPIGASSYSISGFYHVIMQTESGVRKLSRKETINCCIQTAIEQGRMADGNK